jgi:branched-chain amino acid transport system ATP-binding protein
MEKNNTQSLRSTGDRPVILSGSDITKFFGGLAALSGLDFQLAENQILGLIGPNGAGKTTLFNVIAGVYKPDRGVIRLRDEIISGFRPDQICRKGIARTFQITKPFLAMTALENVVVGSYFGCHGKRNLRECRAHAEQILSFVGLADKKYALASQLTLVERKGLELARSLSTEPSILLLDEVVGGLNPTETSEMVELIKQIRNDGVTILMIEHVMKAVMGVSDRIIVIHHGEKIAGGSPEEISSNKDVIEAYLGDMAHAHFT